MTFDPDAPTQHKARKKPEPAKKNTAFWLVNHGPGCLNTGRRKFTVVKQGKDNTYILHED